MQSMRVGKSCLINPPNISSLALQIKQELEDSKWASQSVQHVWILQQYCNRGTLYDAVDR